MTTDTGSLAPDYAAARHRFLAAATEVEATVTTFAHPAATGPGDTELAIDVARLGPEDAPAALVVVSGTHGVEGFAGSALQTHWLGQPDRLLRPGLALVMIHALNPYGFAWTSRTNEDNVDLNRNFIDWTGQPPANPGYDELADLLVPERWDGESQGSTTTALLIEAERRGFEAMQEIISGGQYHHRRGVFYGGRGPVWSHRWLRAEAPALVGSARRVGVIDLHTGLGPWGHGELIVTPDGDHPITRRARRWWGDVRSMLDGDSVSAELTGDWLAVVEDLWPEAEVTAVCLEFGTVEPVEVLQALRAESWLNNERHRLGREPGADGGEAPGEAIRREVRAAFADDDPAWLAALVPRFHEVVVAAMDQLAGWASRPAVASTDRRPRPVERRLYGLAFVDEFGPIYAVYTLWFNDNGITTAQVSTVFLVWTLVGLALELPSGALADRVDRRHLLGVAFAIRAAGIALWLVWPTLTGVLVGAVLWAIHDALASGSWEAMIHDQLRSEGRADRYGPVMARIGQWSHLGVAAGTLLGAGLLQLDTTLVALGWLTVAAHAGSIALVTTLPPVEPDPSELVTAADGDGPADPSSSALGRWLAVLRGGIGQVVVRPVLGRLVVVGALVEGLFIVDEYLPLLARAQGGSDAAAPVLVLVVWLGLLAGGEVAARWPGLAGRRLGPGLMAGAVVMAGALALGRVWALALVAVGYAVMQATNVVANTRLQERAPGPLRATVTSVRGFGSALVAMVMFVVIGAVADGDDPTPGLYVLLAILVGAGALIMVWLPSPSADPEPTAEGAGPDRA